MKSKVILILILLLLPLAGCGQGKQYVCPDGRTVDKVSECQQEDITTKEKITANKENVCNNDGICKDEETCECNDCKELLKCKELGENEYFLKVGDSKKIGEKQIKLLDLTNDGKAKFKVDSVIREIQRTKEKEIINRIEITTKEINYDTNERVKEGIFLIKPYESKPNEYLFDKVGAEQIIESVRIRLNKVESSKPKNFVRMDVGNTLNQRFIESETKKVEGLKITLVQAFPKGTPSESYAIIKIEKV